MLAPRSINFSYIALYAIPHHGAAYLARDGQSKFSPLSLLPGHIACERLPVHPSGFSIQLEVIAAASKAFTVWKTLLARHFRLTTFVCLLSSICLVSLKGEKIRLS